MMSGNTAAPAGRYGGADLSGGLFSLVTFCLVSGRKP